LLSFILKVFHYKNHLLDKCWGKVRTSPPDDGSQVVLVDGINMDFYEPVSEGSGKLFSPAIEGGVLSSE